MRPSIEFVRCIRCRTTGGTTVRRWMQVVGGLYAVLGIGFLPPINEARMTAAFAFAEDGQGTQLFKAFIDYSFAFGQALFVIGAFLLWTARRSPRPESRPLVWLVVWLEAVFVVGDLWAMQRGYGTTANMVWLGFIAMHLTVVLTGVRVARRADRAPAAVLAGA